MIIEQKHRTPKADVAAPKPHLKPVGDLLLHLMVANKDDFGADRTVSRNIELMSYLLVWMWERDILTILNFWADPYSKILKVLLECSVVAKVFHCALKVLSCAEPSALLSERHLQNSAVAEGVVLSPLVCLLCPLPLSGVLQVLERKLKECVPWESSWHEQLMEEIKRPQKLWSSAARENGSRPKGTCCEVTCQACK